MRVVDLRSDTVTQPTERMREAMARARVGDDVYGEDPTVCALEELAAERMGKEAALFCASGTMANLVAILAHTQRGDAVLCEATSHICEHESTGLSVLAGAVLRPIHGERGWIPPEALEAALHPAGPPSFLPRLVCLENTHNRAGGVAIPPERIAATAAAAHRAGLAVHLDGARIFNAAVALGKHARVLAEPVDSVMFSLSKGLSAPVGSMLCGSRPFIERARRWRQVVGGGMRQAGVLAAAGIVALEEMVDRLVEDHRRAKALARGLTRIPGVVVDPDQVDTNIVLVRVDRDARRLVASLAEQGVLCFALSRYEIRLVTHRHISDEDVAWTVEAFRRVQVST
ncbi:MAG: GntG family PLP-dependent aldolase [Armatimonadota bacterium]|nr:GntG family PLP-dependent aldolase [Armatimonadota bacterium]MDR7439568.1 GntG family PLP-dependent aldolase [Armatimonadota bacterium]MDR7562753.1 GntG family PLP-dependent aldolase [Armatimonadota bacterium]MDR7568027.1 GntG family PLP-dependent aldolase [Armatimonadota bacterium]MDR7601052.1 GntG family PLP-dependent aldolase [Armatimonadota bacterium]